MPVCFCNPLSFRRGHHPRHLARSSSLSPSARIAQSHIALNSRPLTATEKAKLAAAEIEVRELSKPLREIPPIPLVDLPPHPESRNSESREPGSRDNGESIESVEEMLDEVFGMGIGEKVTGEKSAKQIEKEMEAFMERQMRTEEEMRAREEIARLQERRMREMVQGVGINLKEKTEEEKTEEVKKGKEVQKEEVWKVPRPSEHPAMKLIEKKGEYPKWPYSVNGKLKEEGEEKVKKEKPVEATKPYYRVGVKTEKEDKIKTPKPEMIKKIKTLKSTASS